VAEQEPVSRVRSWWMAFARRLPPGVARIAERIAERELILEASSLGFYALVSALPMLTVAFSVVGLAAGDDTLRQFAQQAEERGPAGAGRILEQLVESSGSLSIAAIVFTVWPATAYGGGLRRALSRATGDDSAAPALKGRATAIGLVFALPVLVMAGLPLAALLTTLGDDGLVGTLLGWGVALGAGTGALTLVLSGLYHAFSPEDLDWRDTLRGAAITAVVTTLFSIGFVVYLQVGDIEQRFGGDVIGLIVMLGVYLFVANLLLLAGFEAAAELDDGGLDRASDGDASGPSDARDG
jgi:membrane protein